MDSTPKNLKPAYVSLGFGLDGEACAFLSNWSAKITNGSPLETVARERPIEGRGAVRGSLGSRLDLHGLPIVVRDRQALQMARELLDAPNDYPIFVDVEALENAALGERESPGEIFLKGEVRRATPRCEASIDEARTVAGRLFYALNWLAERERLRVVKRAAEATRTSVN